MRSVRISTFALLVRLCFGLCEREGSTPPMGWTTYYFGCNITEDSVRDMSDGLPLNGLASVGYCYVNLDCWQGNRDAQGNLQPNSTSFPNGMQPVIDHIRSRQLSFGLTSDVNNVTRYGRPGSQGYETSDAKTFASWTIDYFRYEDWQLNATSELQRAPAMFAAIQATNRTVFFAFSGTNDSKVAQKLANVSNSSATSQEIRGDWKSMLTAIDINNEYADYASPGYWNDPGFLQIGLGRLSTEEELTHFSLWSLSKAPLILGLNPVKITQTNLYIVTNLEVIAVNQDQLGRQGKKVAVHLSKLSNISNEVVETNCWRATSMIEPKLRQWIDHPEDGTVRSKMNHRCLTRMKNEEKFILTDCQNRQWTDDRSSDFTWNPIEQTIQNKRTRECLTVQPELEIWAGRLVDSSQAVLLLNRGDSGSEPITLQWSDIGLPANRSASVRDLWARADLGIYTGTFTSPDIRAHSSMMLKVTEQT